MVVGCRVKGEGCRLQVTGYKLPITRNQKDIFMFKEKE